MTTTTTEAGTARSSTSRAADVPLGKPSRSEVCEAIMREAKSANVPYTDRQVNGIIDMLYRARARYRKSKNMYHLSTREIKRFHDILEVVMLGNDTNPDPGSAHELINRYFLRDRELSLVHTRDPRYDQLVHCALAVHIEAA